jgi:histidinol phosphate phosphatase hisN-like protein
MTPEQRSNLRAYLLAEKIAGNTRTPRRSVVGNAEALAAGDPDKSLGFDFVDLSPQEVMEAVAAVCGTQNDLGLREGPGYIDPDRTLDEIQAYGDRLEEAAGRGERILATTGHPAGLLHLYQELVRALAGAGCKIVTPKAGERLRSGAPRWSGDRVRFLGGVGCLTEGAHLHHTHESWPMERLLEDDETPDLVLADHGFAGAAVVRGIPTLAIADVNDPALSVAKVRGHLDVVVPLDDNVNPELYGPIAEYLIGRVLGA